MTRVVFLVATICACCVTGMSLAQDECGTAIPVFNGINPSPPLGVPGSTYSNVGMTTSAGSPVPTCGLNTHDDIWFVYAAAATGLHTFSTSTPSGFAPGTHSDTVLDVLDAASGCPPLVALGCDDDGGSAPAWSSTLSVPLVATSSYYVRVSTWDATPDGSFYLTISPPSAAPTNDECAMATAIFDGINPSPPLGVSGMTYTNELATTSVGPTSTCGHPTQKDDVWFVYAAGVTGPHTFATCTPPGFLAGTHTDTVLSVWDAASGCPPTVEVGCDDDGCSSPEWASIASVSLVANASYYVRVSTWWPAVADGTFHVTVTPPASLPTPPNDDCSGAIPIVEGENGPYDNASATSSGTFVTPASCAVGGVAHPGSNDVFFTYTAPCNGTVDVTTCDPPGFVGTNTDTQITVYPNSCPSPGSVIACNDDGTCGALVLQSFVSFPMDVGTTYLIRVASWAVSGGGTFKVSVDRHTASSSIVGLGCSAGGGAGPTLTISGPPVLGATRTLTVAGAVPASTGFILFSPPATVFSPLPGGCTLYLAQSDLVLFLFIAINGAGGWSGGGIVPSAPYLECLKLSLQGVILPPQSAWPPSLQVTDGLELTLGV
jgi:hypothetical protein